MRTYGYYREGENGEVQRYAVYHRNSSNLSWQHPYDEKDKCPACQGTSEAAPK